MYCSACGKRITENLNYCNSCGVRIEKNPLVVSNSSSPHLARSLTVVGTVGFIGFLAVLKMLLDNGGVDTAAKLVILLAYLVTLFMTCAIMVGHMWKHSGDIRIKRNEPITDDERSPISFRSINTAQLGPTHEPGISVTENTTRTLDQVPIERR